MGAAESRPGLLRRAVNRCTSSRTPDLDEKLQMRLCTLTFDANFCDGIFEALWVRLTDSEWLHSWKALELTRALLLNGHLRCVSRCITPEWHHLLQEMSNGSDCETEAQPNHRLNVSRDHNNSSAPRQGGGDSADNGDGRRQDHQDAARLSSAIHSSEGWRGHCKSDLSSSVEGQEMVASQSHRPDHKNGVAMVVKSAEEIISMLYDEESVMWLLKVGQHRVDMFEAEELDVALDELYAARELVAAQPGMSFEQALTECRPPAQLRPEQQQEVSSAAPSPPTRPRSNSIINRLRYITSLGSSSSSKAGRQYSSVSTGGLGSSYLSDEEEEEEDALGSMLSSRKDGFLRA